MVLRSLLLGCLYLLVFSAAGATPDKSGASEVRSRIIERKLEDWKIKKVAFDEATLDEALSFFKTEAKNLDPEKKGVNFVVTPAARAEAGDGKVSLTLDDVPMAVALKYTVEMLHLTYRVDPFVIMIDKPAADAGR